MRAGCLAGWSQRYRLNAARRLCISFGMFCALFVTVSTQAQGEEGASISAIKGLDFSEVEVRHVIFVETANGRHDNVSLASRIGERLRTHNLVGIEPDTQEWKPLTHPRLLIVMVTQNIPDCPDKLVYLTRIELRERAVREREPQIYSEGISYGGDNLFPAVIERSTATRERFEKDLDGMIDSFATHYWEWNSVRGENHAPQR